MIEDRDVDVQPDILITEKKDMSNNIIAYILQVLVLAGCILLTVKPDISNFRPQSWWTRPRLIVCRIIFAAFAVVLAVQLVQSIIA